MIRLNEVHPLLFCNVQIVDQMLMNLVRAAAAALQAREGIRADLIVAACGPKNAGRSDEERCRDS